jgi:DNA-binding response OmpR family regulator
VQTHFKVGGVVVDTSTRTATATGCELNLTRTEFDLLALFIGAPQRIFSRDELLDGVWGSWYGDDHVVEVHISRLRRKVKAASGLRVCVAVRGIGYKFGVE